MGLLWFITDSLCAKRLGINLVPRLSNAGWNVLQLLDTEWLAISCIGKGKSDSPATGLGHTTCPSRG